LRLTVLTVDWSISLYPPSYSQVAIPLIGSQLAISLPFGVCAICIGFLEDEIALSAFGLTCTVINVFFNGFFFGFAEVLGSYASRGFGAKNYKMMGKALYQVLHFKSTFLIFLFD
jgi:Na+-driven multidrug efflux pump